MAGTIKRRGFLAGAVTAAGAAAVSAAPPSRPAREHYELRVYQNTDPAKKKLVDAYLRDAFVPALNRMGIDRVGVFTRMDDEADHAIYTLIPYPTLEKFAGLNDALEADKEYQAAAKPHFDRPKKDPAFARINSRFMRAFTGMPVIEMPPESRERKPRLFELRTYESHTEEKARLKVAMFNEGEMQVMRDVKMQPVFYGEMLVGDDVPNLTYMLSAGDMDSHKAHWQAFLKHPTWNKMKTMERYKDTVSKITKRFLAPTGYSQI